MVVDVDVMEEGGLEGGATSLTSFEFRDAPAARRVALAGAWEGWRPVEMRGVGGGCWVLDVRLAPGETQFKFVLDGEVWTTSRAYECADDGHGGENNVRVVALPAAEKAEAQSDESELAEPAAEEPVVAQEEKKDDDMCVVM